MYMHICSCMYICIHNLNLKGWRCNSVIEQLLSTCEVLESIPGTNKKGEGRKKERKNKKLRNKTNVFPISVLYWGLTREPTCGKALLCHSFPVPDFHLSPRVVYASLNCPLSQTSLELFREHCATVGLQKLWKRLQHDGTIVEN